MEDLPLIHVGILGMRWGIRRRASGQLNTSVRGKSVPATTSIRGKSAPMLGGKTKVLKQLKSTSVKDLDKNTDSKSLKVAKTIALAYLTYKVADVALGTLYLNLSK